jgi:ribosome-associated protein
MELGTIPRPDISQQGSPMITISDGILIPEDELTFTASRSSGPGGQNVNKVSTRMTLCFDLENSGSFTEEQKAKIRENLATRITRSGILRVTSQKHRSQTANRDMAIERFIALINDALTETPPRRPTRMSRQARRQRLADKKHRSRIKQKRGPVDPDNE